MKYVLAFVIILVVIFVFVSITTKLGGTDKDRAPVLNLNQDPIKEKATTIQAITEQFSKKYKKPVSDIIIETEIDTGSFAKGSVRYKNEFGGAIWFGAKTSKGWELAADGQGPMNCEVAEKYNFPSDLVPSCLDSKNNNALITR